MRERSRSWHAGADSADGSLTSTIDRRLLDAHRAGCSVDGGRSPETVWRHRTGRSLADRGTGRAGPRRHAVRQRRFLTSAKLDATWPKALAARRLGARSQCAAHGDAGAGPAEMRRRRVRLPPLSSRLLSVLAVLRGSRRRSSPRCMAGSIFRSISRCSRHSPRFRWSRSRMRSAGRCRRPTGSAPSITACRRTC